MAPPRFTIGLSVRDAEPYLRACLASIFAQTVTDWELIAVDDGSHDQSRSMLRSVRDDRVRLLPDGGSRGLAVRLNQLVRAARAPYFVRMDADDIMHPERLAILANALGAPDDATVVGSHAYAIDAANRVVGRIGQPPDAGQGFDVFIHPTVAAPTSWFRAHPYDEDPAFRRCEDAELWPRARAQSRYVVLEQALLYYRTVGTFSLDNYLATQRGMRHVVRRHFRHPWHRRLRLLAGLRLRSLAYRLATWTGRQDGLIRRRTRPVEPEERVRAEIALAQALHPTVPGLPSR